MADNPTNVTIEIGVFDAATIEALIRKIERDARVTNVTRLS